MDEQIAMAPVDTGKSAGEGGTTGTRMAGTATQSRPDPAGLPIPAEHEDGPREIFQGVVRLVVDADGRTQPMLHFVDELGRKPQFRLLRLVGNYRDKGMDIWLGLREPLYLKELLLETEGVSRVNYDSGQLPEGEEPVLNVVLAEAVPQ